MLQSTKLESDETAEEKISIEQISTSVTSSDASSSESLTKPSPLVPDLQDISKENAETTDTTNSVNIDNASPDTLQIEICSESEKSDSQTAKNIVTFKDEGKDLKNEDDNEIVSSVEEEPAETIQQPSAVVVAPSSLGSVADSSTSQEEVSESQGKSLEDVENTLHKFTEVQETNSIDELVPEPKLVTEAIPMEVDIVTESDSKEIAEADEPSSTSTDINL